MVILLVPFLLACTEAEKNDDYYMQHPLELKQAIMACQGSFVQGVKAAHCDMMMRAAVNMEAIVNQQQEDPERFGQRILHAEETLAQLKLAMIEAGKKAEDSHLSPAESKRAQDDLDNAKKAYDKQYQEVKVLLAVLGMGGP